jgi:hypothetical protein
MSRLFSTPSHVSPGLFGFLIAGVLSFAAASCLGVLELDTYESASEQICSLYDRCYGAEAFVGCRRHVAGQIETVDPDERADLLDEFADCLDDCQHVSDCLDQPLFCAAIRENCAADAMCCGFAAGLAACVGQSCCLVKDAVCNRDADCCAGACAGGKCQGSVGPVCAQAGAACNASADCCNGNCAGGVCAAACSPQAAACTINADCCSNICINNVCVSQCSIRGSACSIDTDCCSGNCSNGICRKGGCFAAGALCLSDADCCQDSCDKGRGICGNAGCYADGLPCSQDGDCCAGLACNPADKRCATLSCKKYNDTCVADADCCGLYCSGSCQCAPNGTTCTQAEAFKCCSGACENGACVDCRPGGTACSSGSQCCSGTCNNGACCNVGCSHSLCTVGTALSTNDCSPKNVGAAAASCVSTICAQDPACCCNMWDQSCVDKVASVCKFVCP